MTLLPKLHSLTPTSSELAARKLGPANLLRALEALHEDGIVMIEGVVNEKHLDMVGPTRTLYILEE
jgi:hypothetical protein